MNFLKTPLTIFEKLEFTNWEISDTNFDFSPSGKSQPWEAQASVCAKQAWDERACGFALSDGVFIPGGVCSSLAWMTKTWHVQKSV